MTTTEPTMHNFLEVSAAVADPNDTWSITGKWERCVLGNGWTTVGPDPINAKDATADELDAQVGRLAEQMTKLGWRCCHVEESDGMPAEFVWMKSDVRPENSKRPLFISCHPDYNTAVYLAAEKIGASK